MTVHFLHTSDWHLGQYFHQHSRDFEHQQFLTWLLQQIEQKQPHALLIAGDIFDVVNPSSTSLRQLNQFLSDAHLTAPYMQILMIAGNHDSGYRIEQVEPLLDKYNAKAVGLVTWHEDHTLNTDRLLVPIYDQQKNIVAWCVMLPFLRHAEITGHLPKIQDPMQAVTFIYQSLIQKALAQKTDDQALIVMTHAHIQHAKVSESERSIIIGNLEALPTQIFTQHVDYVALGHLHKPQGVQYPFIRYSGSPIPLSFSEINYRHQVVEVTINPQATDEQKLIIDALPVPRSVQLYHISGNLNEVLNQLKQLPYGDEKELDQRDFVHVEYFCPSMPPLDVRQQIENSLPPNRYRLVSISRKTQLHTPRSNSHTPVSIDIQPPTPEQLFKQLLAEHDIPYDEQVAQDFAELLEQAQQHLTQ